MIKAKRQGKASRPNRLEMILDTAVQVFLRYGFHKTSMDDLAEASGLSRQGLYVHFKRKEELFKAALVRLKDKILSRATSIANQENLTLEEKLLSVFEALHGGTLDMGTLEHRNELLEFARSTEGSIVTDLEQEFIRIVTGLLANTEVSAGWGKQGISPRQLSEHLFALATGSKSSAATPAIHRARMKVAVKIIMKGI